jgi:cytochrome c-type biogenesis protein CcmH
MNSSVAAHAALVCVLALSMRATPVMAAEALPVAEDPQLEARVLRVSEELRCLVCQNQTIADSNADLAKDLRREVRQMLMQGKSEAEVREFMVTRYGDFILYRPPFMWTTLLLWMGPFVLLLAAAWIHRRMVTRRSEALATSALTKTEQQRLQALTGTEPGPRRG